MFIKLYYKKIGVFNDLYAREKKEIEVLLELKSRSHICGLYRLAHDRVVNEVK